MLTQHLTADILKIALDRSRALSVEISRIEKHQYPPTGPERLIKLVKSANSQISQDLSDRLRNTSTLPSTPDRRIEIFLRAKTNLLSFLHSLLQCIEGADFPNCPSTFVVPIRSMLKQKLKQQAILDFDFIVRSSRTYNYMIWTIHGETHKVFLEAGYSALLSNFPKPFFIIECPISERRNIPIHCMFAHEVGHIWYQTSRLAGILLPLVQRANEPLQNKLIKAAWVEELAADAIALCLFGPAYLYAFIYFAGPFCSMNIAFDTHPPDNIRIKLLCDMLLNKHNDGGLAYKNILASSNTTAANLEYITQWQSYARDSTRSGSVQHRYRPIVHSIESILVTVMKETKKSTKIYGYSRIRFKKDIPVLCENIARGIPPNEIILDYTKGVRKTIKAESILNAGWSYLIGDDQRYANLLGIDDKWKITNRLFGLVSKGLEYSEMQRRWNKKI